MEALKEMCRGTDPNPPLEDMYKALINKSSSVSASALAHNLETGLEDELPAEEMELPLIDLGRREKEEWKREVVEASMELGFFRVTNHGVSGHTLEAVREEQTRVFREPFLKKQNDALMNMSPGSYRWGTPTAMSLGQLSWSEAFHVPLDDVFSARWGARLCTSETPRSAMRRFATKVSALAQDVATILAENLGQDSALFKHNCSPSTCYLRMNRYPPCPNHSKLFGLMPHTDTDFLTILHEDHVGGLQIVKDGRWIAVKPHPGALIVNIGDLFQVWSNGVYKSVEHRVVANQVAERLSTAYFFCPSNDTVIRSCGQPRLYKEFSFKEYRQQVQTDVKTLGHKIGLSHFLLSTTAPMLS